MISIMVALLLQAGGLAVEHRADPFQVTVRYTSEAPRDEARVMIQTDWDGLQIRELTVYNMTTELAYEFNEKSFVIRGDTMTVRLSDMFGGSLDRDNMIGISIRAGNGDRVIIDGLRMQIQ